MTSDSRIALALIAALDDKALDLLAERLESRLATRMGAGCSTTDRWLSTREAAQHLGMHPDTLRRLAATRVIPSEQDRPGCALHFRLSALERWRESGGPRFPRAEAKASTRLPRDGEAA
jgi:excisionase family DNA binding protein